MHINEFFHKFACAIAAGAGSPWAFVAAVCLVVVWALSGPYFDYSEGWQLVINTGTTIATFLMVFLLQNAQNREAKAVNIKLDELLRAIEGARTGFVNAEALSDEEIDRLLQELQRLGKREGVRPLQKTVSSD